MVVGNKIGLQSRSYFLRLYDHDENTKLQMWILIPVKYKLLWFKLRFWFQWLLSVYYSYLKPEISWNYLWLAMRHVGLVSLLHHTRILPDCIKILQSCYYTSGFKNFLLQAKTPAIKFYQCCIMETFSFQIFTVLTILWLESRIWRKKELLKILMIQSKWGDEMECKKHCTFYKLIWIKIHQQK